MSGGWFGRVVSFVEGIVRIEVRGGERCIYGVERGLGYGVCLG